MLLRENLVKVSHWISFLRYIVLIIFGLLLIFAFPSFNYYLIAWVGLIPLYFLAKNLRWHKAWLAGYVWGFAWSVASCFWLREIEPFIPFAISLILACYYAFWAMGVSIVRRYLFIPVNIQLDGFESVKKYYKTHNFYFIECLSALFLASWWCVLEWLRTWLFTGFSWNLLAVTQWKEYPIIQIASYTGIYGISFIIVFFNIALGDAILRYYSILKNNYKKGLRPVSLYLAILLLALSFLFGVRQINKYQKVEKGLKPFSAAVVEGNIPQCRLYNAQQANHALDVYIRYSNDILLFKPDILIWPESAVPQPLRGGGALSEKYRKELGSLLKKYRVPILLGTTDFGFGKPGDTSIYNSALYISGNGSIIDKYNKIHIVPWGEYTPFENLFPFNYFYPWIKMTFGMGRSITAGTKNTIFDLTKDVRGAVLICYEDVFPEIARDHVLAGANLLILITNDAWYPTSDEPEQHLAQAVFRAVENGRIMVRVGNSAGTCVVQPTGAIVDSLFHKLNTETGRLMPDPTKRGAGTGIFNLMIQKNPPLTFYTKYGNVFILFCSIISVIGFLWFLYQWKEKKRLLLNAVSEPEQQ